MITDLIQIKTLGEQKRGENEKFRQHLRRHGYVERRFRKIAEQVEDGIDCMQCAQCCRKVDVPLLERDIEKLSKFLRLNWYKFLREYCEEVEPEKYQLRRDPENGCPFLIGNECSVYEARPSFCDDFPHLIHGRGSFHARMWQMIDRATYCPITYNAFEAMKVDVGFKG
jgi:uncharacterized protein